MSNFLITHYHRAGSTLLQNLLGSHDDVVCYFRPFGNDWYDYDKTISSVENFFDWIYIRKDDKRFRGWLERKNKADNTKVKKMESVKDKLDIHEEEMRRENG